MSVLGDSLEILDGLDAQGVVKELNPGDTKARYPHEIEQTLRHPFAEAGEVRRLAGFDQLADHGQCGGPDPRGSYQLAGIE